MRISDDVVKALNGELSLQGSKVKVAVDKGAVTLSGTVTNQAQADKAADIAAKKAKGKVTNSLTIG